MVTRIERSAVTLFLLLLAAVIATLIFASTVRHFQRAKDFGIGIIVQHPINGCVVELKDHTRVWMTTRWGDIGDTVHVYKKRGKWRTHR